jgi:hypothetical protein
MICSMLTRFASFFLNCFRNFCHCMKFDFLNFGCFQFAAMLINEMANLLQIFYFFGVFTFPGFRFLMGKFQIHFNYVSINGCHFDLHSKNQGCLKTLITRFFQN